MKKYSLVALRSRLQPLHDLLIKQNHKTLVLWSLDCAQSILPVFTCRYPHEPRPLQALDAARAWARGEIKMPVAKKAAHATHNVATEIAQQSPAACAAARALGHVVGTVHTGAHAIGVAIYGSAAWMYSAAPEEEDAVFSGKQIWMIERLHVWEAAPKDGVPWAAFMNK